MANIDETRRRRTAPTGSQKVFSGGNTTEITQNPTLFNQIAWLSARYEVGYARARLIAEHAYQNGSSA